MKSILGWATFVAVCAWAGWSVAEAQRNLERQYTERQKEVNTFYAKHKCKPEGYLSTRYEVVRTYRCDNGLFIAEDMLKGE